MNGVNICYRTGKTKRQKQSKIQKMEAVNIFDVFWQGIKYLSRKRLHNI